MADLLQLLGMNVASPEAKHALARFPSLRAEIEDLGPGQGLEPVHYLRSEDDGLLIKCSPEGEIRAIFLMSEGHDGFEAFPGKLPGNLTFESSPADAMRAFGKPAFHRPAGRMGGLQLGDLLRFDWPGHSVHFQFRGDGSGIELVTAMVARSVPGRSQGPQAPAL